MAEGPVLHWEIDPDEMTLGQLIRVEGITSRLIREVTSQVAGAPLDAVKWIVKSVRSGSPITYELQPKAPADTIPPLALAQAVDAITSGLARLSSDVAVRPQFFTDEALERARDLGRELGDNIRAVRFYNGHPKIPRAEVTKRTAANVEAILAQDVFEALGTVEGRLEAVNVHNRRYFNVYDDLGGHRIECQFGERVPLEEVGAAIGKRVGVYGTLVSREDGRVVRARVDEFEAFPEPEHLPNLDDVEGITA